MYWHAFGDLNFNLFEFKKKKKPSEAICVFSPIIKILSASTLKALRCFKIVVIFLCKHVVHHF